MNNFWLKMSEYSKRFNTTFISEESDGFCNSRMTEDIAIVEVLFSNQFVTMFEQDVRTSFADKISSIGMSNNVKKPTFIHCQIFYQMEPLEFFVVQVS